MATAMSLGGDKEGTKDSRLNYLMEKEGEALNQIREVGWEVGNHGGRRSNGGSM